MASDRFGWNNIIRQAWDGASNLKKWVTGRPVPGGPLKAQQDREVQAKQKLEREAQAKQKLERGKIAPLEKDPPKPNHDPVYFGEKDKAYKEALEYFERTRDKDSSKDR
jgi:hypothetical protein